MKMARFRGPKNDPKFWVTKLSKKHKFWIEKKSTRRLVSGQRLAHLFSLGRTTVLVCGSYLKTKTISGAWRRAHRDPRVIGFVLKMQTSDMMGGQCTDGAPIAMALHLARPSLAELLDNAEQLSARANGSLRCGRRFETFLVITGTSSSCRSAVRWVPCTWWSCDRSCWRSPAAGSFWNDIGDRIRGRSEARVPQAHSFQGCDALEVVGAQRRSLLHKSLFFAFLISG